MPFMLRQAQHERKKLNDFNTRSVHPEPVEGRKRVCSLQMILENYRVRTGPAVAAHIHLASPGTAGPVIVPLTLGAGGRSPALLQGNLYFNVHTSAYMAGEARVQIVAGDGNDFAYSKSACEI
jgi:hypothetical protein